MGITTREFEQIQKRLSAPRPRAAPVEMRAVPAPGAPTIILGIDPSLRGTGYGVIRYCGRVGQILCHGTVRCPPAWEHSRCLVKIYQSIRDIIGSFRPTICAVEGLFYAQNIKTALVMGEARGASLVAAAEGGLEIYELAPRKVKQAVVGYGAAQKSAVAKMVQRMLNLPQAPEPDAADALALALTHALESRSFGPAPKRI